MTDNTCVYCERPAPTGHVICSRAECKAAWVRENRQLDDWSMRYRIGRSNASKCTVPATAGSGNDEGAASLSAQPLVGADLLRSLGTPEEGFEPPTRRLTGTGSSPRAPPSHRDGAGLVRTAEAAFRRLAATVSATSLVVLPDPRARGFGADESRLERLALAAEVLGWAASLATLASLLTLGGSYALFWLWLTATS